MLNKKYYIKSLNYLVNDQLTANFHVNHRDYFGTIAAIVSLVKQQLVQGGYDPVLVQKTLNDLSEDVLFAQNNYQIKPKTKKRKIIPKGRDNSQ